MTLERLDGFFTEPLSSFLVRLSVLAERAPAGHLERCAQLPPEAGADLRVRALCESRADALLRARGARASALVSSPSAGVAGLTTFACIEATTQGAPLRSVSGGGPVNRRAVVSRAANAQPGNDPTDPHVRLVSPRG